VRHAPPAHLLARRDARELLLLLHAHRAVAQGREEGGELTVSTTGFTWPPGSHDRDARALVRCERAFTGPEIMGDLLKRTDMPRQIITTPNAPSSPLFSQGVKAGSQVLISGTTGIDPSTGELAGNSIQVQTRQALANCEAILQAGGASLDDVVDVGVLLTDPGDFAGMNEEYAQWFRTDPPSRYVARLGAELPGLLVSIRMTAFIT
jgi:reactive intermediate/imine deaminase